MKRVCRSACRASSICSRVGHLLTFVPPSQFTLHAGEGAQNDYPFNRKNIHHLFCKTCGVRSFGRGTAADGSAVIAINVRALDGVDLDALTVQKVDGKRL